MAANGVPGSVLGAVQGFATSAKPAVTAMYKPVSTKVQKEVSDVRVNPTSGGASMGSSHNSATGQTIDASNPLIQSEAQANTVAEWMKNVLKNRLIMSGDYRADPRVDVLDPVSVQDEFTRSRLVLTSITFTYNGAFRGRFEGRVMEES